MFVNKLFTYITCTISKSKRCLNVKSSTYYFHMKTKILAKLQICVSVTLKTLVQKFPYAKVMQEKKLYIFTKVWLFYEKICITASNSFLCYY